jgi:hypothetical protein
VNFQDKTKKERYPVYVFITVSSMIARERLLEKRVKRKIKGKVCVPVEPSLLLW